MEFYNFSNKHIGIEERNLKEMLKVINVKSLEELIAETIPSSIRLKDKFNIGVSKKSEMGYLKHIEKVSAKNKCHKNYIGMGYHPTFMPSVIKRNIFENPSWYTAYTPYQSEISQGRLEALLNFQTFVVELTGMEIANASLLDESTAAAEAMSLLYGLRTKAQKINNSKVFFVSDNVLPQTVSVLKGRAEPLGIEIKQGNPKTYDFNETYFGILIQYPSKYGEVEDYSALIKKVNKYGIKSVFSADILSLMLLIPPSEFGADVVVGSTQRFGIPVSFGGPHAAFFATKDIYKRHIPGRIIGVSKDVSGKPAYRMALQTREQHIKRDKATSNICTSQVFLAVLASMYAVYYGEEGLKQIANRIHTMTKLVYFNLLKLGFEVENKTFFDTLKIKVDTNAIRILAEEEKINFFYIDRQYISLSINEITTFRDIIKIISIFKKMSGNNSFKILQDNSDVLPSKLLRTGTILNQSVFKKYHTETEIMRYIRRLELKDISLTRSMIALGSCTMKLNAASQMIPLLFKNWSDIHPFAPAYQTKAYIKVLTKLETYLSKITGFYATSLQPNSGAQGEFAGLLIIRAFHKKKTQENRNVCLIPTSAHGTNPASAVMAGMHVVFVKTAENGYVDIEDLKRKIEENKINLGALMVTYPSTYGVFDMNIKEVTGLIHNNGGLVYMDGANMNAQVGLTNPANIGADVCHLNLHKTFAIPHGGGGPGVGPICVTKDLAEFLPTNPLCKVGGKNGIRSISASPYGSAYISLVSYGYIRLLGSKGLKKSTQYAILNANYIKAKINNDFKILFKGNNDRVAHELIIDCRVFKKKGIEVMDIAKRLIDYGFHAPTVSFPILGTLMIEPTESESLDEMDRFCEALLSIKKEIETIPEILKNAPHTAEMIVQEWPYSYSIEKAVFPINSLKTNKYWPPVRRIDDAYGDRNLMCTC